ncbi:unnamed protein product [Adineta steineri]|uniref:Uncharacterized protein n=1 Tax=Adineta steineri TaxID=433720 RepID=A0A815NJS9_9BILA|nr:unnamed protein product [Adineta steineri]CAF1207792.1 unnamed protein product [Adineta steineri]CAF1439223.1 unnamed protein product [Adineta steineri]CAF4004173.1 unnamed protein product [Adineta steineri]CAF4028743.1 unnamed protein product [Adineta steineri]
MSDTTREDIERMFQQKLAELDHREITMKEEFVPIVDAFLKFCNDYTRIIKSAISRGISSVFGVAMTFDTKQATRAAMESVLQWLYRTNEQDPDKIGYIIDQYMRYWLFYHAENYHLEDPSALRQFEPDLEFRNYHSSTQYGLNRF